MVILLMAETLYSAHNFQPHNMLKSVKLCMANGSI